MLMMRKSLEEQLRKTEKKPIEFENELAGELRLWEDVAVRLSRKEDKGILVRSVAMI
jgi:hypothetical protein